MTSRNVTKLEHLTCI